MAYPNYIKYFEEYNDPPFYRSLDIPQDKYDFTIELFKLEKRVEKIKIKGKRINKNCS